MIVDKKVESRATHLRVLRKLIKTVRDLDLKVDDNTPSGRKAPSPLGGQKLFAAFKEKKPLDRKLQATFPRFRGFANRKA